MKIIKLLGRAAIILAGLLLLTVGAVSARGAQSKTVIFAQNGTVKTVMTYAETIEDFFREQGISVMEADRFSPKSDEKITENMNISFIKAANITVIIDGEEMKFSTQRDTVKTVAENLGRETGSVYYYNNKLANMTVSDDTILELSTKETKQFETKKPIPFETVATENPDLPLGVVKVIKPGADGEKIVVTRVSYVAGVEAERVQVGERLIREPETQFVEKGTKKTVNGYTGEEVFNYSQKFTMSVTSYTANYACTGKNPGDRGFGITSSGTQARVGAVAVDPRVIPIGTKLYIEGYGFAVAEDTGSAIKGEKLDLYFDTYDECLKFGRQNLVVYVIAE